MGLLLGITYTLDLLPVDRALPKPVAKHSKPQEWKGNILREEYFADLGGDSGECVSHASYYNVLEKRGMLDERRSLCLFREVSFSHQLIWKRQSYTPR